MEEIQIIAVIASIISLAFAALLTSMGLKKDGGNDQIRFIGDAIQKGAMAFYPGNTDYWPYLWW